MLRILLKKRRFVPILVVCMFLTTMIPLIFDETLEQQEHYHPRGLNLKFFQNVHGNQTDGGSRSQNDIVCVNTSCTVAAVPEPHRDDEDEESLIKSLNDLNQVVAVGGDVVNLNQGDVVNEEQDDVTNEDQNDVTNQDQNDVTNQDQDDVMEQDPNVMNQGQRNIMNEDQNDVMNQGQNDVVNQSQVNHIMKDYVHMIMMNMDKAGVPKDPGAREFTPDNAHQDVQADWQNDVNALVHNMDIVKEDGERNRTDVDEPLQVDPLMVPSNKGWTPPPNAGEEGRPVVVDEKQLSDAQRQAMKAGRRTHMFNEFVSNFISLHRTLKDVRIPECQEKQYDVASLPDTSVVIIFHNEAWSTLLRTVHSVIDRSPPQLIKEIILVDDASDLPHLLEPLDDYVSQLDKVTVVRMPSRQGLIQARLTGLELVTATTVVFLDSHCECLPGWLEPLLERIGQDPTTVVVPVIEVLDMETWEYHHSQNVKDFFVGSFNWGLTFTWIPIQPSEKARRKSDIDPIRSPTMAGGLFGINVDFFKKLGTYDPGMKIWGGENLELSFKLWMCGGTLETIPCSFVGHVFRNASPHTQGSFKNYLTVNLARLAAVWMDDYIYYTSDYIQKQKSNVTDRLELRRNLNCHSFGWYLKNVIPERYLPSDPIAHGMLENPSTGLCIASQGKKGTAEVKNCQPTPASPRFLQWNMNPGEFTVFQLADDYSRTGNTLCLDYSGTSTLDVFPCHNQGGNQLWTYSKELKQLYHKLSNTCAEVGSEEDGLTPKLIMSVCNPTLPAQKWEWDTSQLPGPSWRKDLAEGRPVL